MNEIYEFAIQLAHKAGKNALSYFGEQINIDLKSDESPVTIADRSTEELIRKEIESHFPDDGILGEEFGEKPGKTSYRWILDPIDGTKTFIRGVPFFGTLIAVEKDGESIIGVADFPALDISISAMTGFGCYSNGQKCQVSETIDLIKASVMFTDAKDILQHHGEKTLINILTQTGFQRTWADCYGYYLVAVGKVDMVFDVYAKIWDIAPMIPIINEAGGKISASSGLKELSMQNIIASNKTLHPQLRNLFCQK